MKSMAKKLEWFVEGDLIPMDANFIRCEKMPIYGQQNHYGDTPIKSWEWKYLYEVTQELDVRDLEDDPRPAPFF